MAHSRLRLSDFSARRGFPRAQFNERVGLGSTGRFLLGERLAGMPLGKSCASEEGEQSVPLISIPVSEGPSHMRMCRQNKELVMPELRGRLSHVAVILSSRNHLTLHGRSGRPKTTRALPHAGLGSYVDLPMGSLYQC